MLTQLPLCAPAMEVFHTDFRTKFRHLEKQQYVAELHWKVSAYLLELPSRHRKQRVPEPRTSSHPAPYRADWQVFGGLFLTELEERGHQGIILLPLFRYPSHFIKNWRFKVKVAVQSTSSEPTQPTLISEHTPGRSAGKSNSWPRALHLLTWVFLSSFHVSTDDMRRWHEIQCIQNTYVLFTLQALDTRHRPLQLCILNSVTPVCDNSKDPRIIVIPDGLGT